MSLRGPTRWVAAELWSTGVPHSLDEQEARDSVYGTKSNMLSHTFLFPSECHANYIHKTKFIMILKSAVSDNKLKGHGSQYVSFPPSWRTHRSASLWNVLPPGVVTSSKHSANFRDDFVRFTGSVPRLREWTFELRNSRSVLSREVTSPFLILFPNLEERKSLSPPIE